MEYSVVNLDIWTSLKMPHLNEPEQKERQGKRERKREVWWHCRFVFCLICINVKVITMQATPSLFLACPQCVYRFATCLTAFSPKKDSELWAVSVTTPIQSLTRCLHAHRARQDAIRLLADHEGADTATGTGAGTVSGTARPSSCCTQVRLLPLGCTSFEGEPKISTADQSQVPRATPPSHHLPNLCSSWLAGGLDLATNEEQRFNNFALKILFERISCQAISGHICVTSAAIPPLSHLTQLSMIWASVVVALTMNWASD